MDREDLLERLRSQSFIGGDVYDAFAAVDRADFVRGDHVEAAYKDKPLPIGHGQTISQPHTVGFMLSLLDVEPGMTVLDIGSGSAYTTALLAELVGHKGSVKGLEIIEDLVGFGRSNLAPYEYDWASIEQATPGVLGDPDGLYDRVLVSAAARSVPDELLDQVKVGGVVVVPVKNEILRIERTGHAPEDHRVDRYEGFRFVPLRRER
jgi:protein-L-isoaspartate(D-aspartate) O-methyltransferase